MIVPLSSSCSSCKSYLFNYEMQNRLYEWYHKKSSAMKSFKISTLGVWTTSCLITLITRICGIVEVIFTEDSVRHKIIHTLKNILRSLYTIPLFINGAFWSIYHPKFFILLQVEYSRVNLKYARYGNIGTDEQQKELELAQKKANEKLLEYCEIE